MTNLSKAMINHADALGLNYNAVGGPTMGADVVGHGMVAHHPNPDMGWFTVRDQPKTTHGLGKWIEGTEIGPNHSVILTDDVADSGKSLVDAYHKVKGTGAQVSAVMPVVDRGNRTRQQFDALGVPYHPLMNYEDLGINPLSGPRQGPPQ
jgi:orotate phosphoribosyltransferase